jgi:hypothetical protein
LGGGLKAGFMAQMRFDPASGGASSTSYGQPMEQVKTSISGGFGSVDLGKFTIDNGAGWIRPFGSDDSLKAYGASPTTRSASQIAYNTPAISGFKAQIVKIQGDSAAAATNNDGTQVTIKYDANNIQAYVSISNKVNGVDAITASTVSNAPTFTAAQTDVTEFGAAYNFGVVRVALGQTKQQATAGGVETTENALGLQMPVNAALSLGLGFGKFSTSNNSGVDGQKKTHLVANYSLSKRTTLLAKYLKVSGNATAASNGNGSFLGLSHTF